MQSQIKELEKLEIEEQDTLRLAPCFSPVWDTALTMVALTESGLEPGHPALLKAAKWLLWAHARYAHRPGAACQAPKKSLKLFAPFDSAQGRSVPAPLRAYP